MVPDDAVARRLLASVPFHTPDVQADRRAMIRRKAYVAARLLDDATMTFDGDELAALVCEADRAIGDAVTEIMRARLA